MAASEIELTKGTADPTKGGEFESGCDVIGTVRSADIGRGSAAFVDEFHVERAFQSAQRDRAAATVSDT